MKRGGQVLAGLLDDFSQVDKALDTMESAAGSADKEMDIIRDSIEYTINDFKQSWVQILQELVDRGDLKNIIEFFSTISKSIGGVISNLGLLQTALVGIGTFLGSKKLGLLNYNKDAGFSSKMFGSSILSTGLNKAFLQRASDSNIKAEDIDNLALAYNGLDKSVIQYAKDAKAAGAATGDLVKGFKGAYAPINRFAQGLKNIGGTLLSTLVNAAVSAGISLLVSGAITGLSAIVDGLIKTKKEIREAAKEARNNVQEINDNLKTNVETVNNVKDRYSELAQEVSGLGTLAQNQGTLSNDEYQEFLDISNQLAEKFPQLTQGYNSNGDAILKLSGDVDTIVGSLNDLIDAETQLANQEIAEQLPDLWAGYGLEVDEYNQKIDEAKSNIEQFDNLIKQTEGSQGIKVTTAEDALTLRYAAEMVGLEGQIQTINNHARADAMLDDYYTYDIIDFSNLSQEQITALKNVFISLRQTYIDEVGSFEDTISSKGKEMGEYISSKMFGSGFYKDNIKGNDNIKALFNNLLLNYDYEGLLKEFEGDFEGAYGVVFGDLSQMFKNVDKNEFNKIWDEIFDLEGDTDIPYIDKIEQLNTLLLQLAELLPGIDINKLKEVLGLSSIEDSRNKVIERFDTKTTDRHGKKTKAYAEYEDFINGLNDTEFNLWEDALNDGRIPSDLYSKGRESWKEYLRSLQNIADQNALEIKGAAAVDTMADMKTAITSLNDLWEQTVNNRLKTGKDNKYLNEDGSVTKEINSQNYAEGFADPALINSVESAFSKFIDEAAASGKDVDKLNAALLAFEDTMVKTPGDAKAAQKAIDNLITAYIDQTEAIQKLDESTKDWSIAQLKAMGIENAEEVVTARLNKKITTLLKNTKGLSDAIKQYGKVLESNNKLDGQLDQSIKETSAALQEMFSDLMGDTGVDLSQIFDADFIVANLDAVKTAALGDVDAIYQLQKAAAQDIMMHVGLSIPDANVAENIKNEINGLIAEFPIDDIEVGTELNDYPLIQGLNRLVNAGEITRDSMNAILSSIGVEPDITYEKADIKGAIDFYGLKGSAAAAAAQSMKSSISGEIRVPKLNYKMTNKASGAKYSPSGGGSTSGSGDSSSKSEPNKPKEEAAETFDWLEVYIKRLQEAEESLDKTVNNTYKNWSKRNKALSKEIKKVGEEINAQKYAQERYEQYADSLQVNNGKRKVNDDDYGENDTLIKAADQAALDEAFAIWESKKYQNLIKAGKFGGEDIEKIQNRFLKEMIQEYQPWIDKSIAAGKALEDLEIKQSENFQKRFDNVKTAFEESIALIQHSANMIDKQIEYTQERGYFESSKYYNELIKNMEAQNVKLNKELAQLIKKRDEAVATGSIEKNSSAWNQMTQDINAVTEALKDNEKQILSWRNTIWQNAWDVSEYMEERVKRVSQQAQNWADLMSSHQLFEDDGRFTKYGEATNGMYAIQYQTAANQLVKLEKQRDNLEKQLKEDPYNQKKIAQLEAIEDAAWEATNAMKAASDAMKSLLEQAFQQNLSNLDKIISKYKKISNEAKEAYEYSKNISNQIKNIDNLERTLNAYMGDDSEEARKIRQQTAAQLEDAKTQLQETEWDKAISETEKLIDNMREEYEELFNEELKKIDEVTQRMIENATENSADIKKTIQELSGKLHFDLTPAFEEILNPKNNNDILSATNKTVEDIRNNVRNMVQYLKPDQTSATTETKTTTTTNKKTATEEKTVKEVGGTTTGAHKLTAVGVGESADGVEHLSDVGVEVNKYGPNKSAQLEKEIAKFEKDIEEYTANIQRHRLTIKSLEMKGSGITKKEQQALDDAYAKIRANEELIAKRQNSINIRKRKLGYAKGSRRIPQDQLAWTQENGTEIIYRTSDGAMLTPLSAGDMVFTNEMSKKLYDFAKGDLPNVMLSGSVPNVQSTIGTNISNNNAISITLPNVQNYDQFKEAMKKDNNMQDWMKEVTLGPVLGKNTLRKNRY